jgi:hypothetical protein
MTRSLPPHPNLDHLKKQAKDVLYRMKQENSAAKLADAQLAIAREYGFASWPKLKAYVDSLSAGLGPAESELASTSPFVGKWTANLSKSKRHPGNQFRSAVLQITEADNSLTMIDVMVDDSGREHRGKNTILVDGQSHAAENGYVLTARWRGPHILVTEASKDGPVIGWGKYEISEDAQTLTISGDEQVIVLDRSE